MIVLASARLILMLRQLPCRAASYTVVEEREVDGAFLRPEIIPRRLVAQIEQRAGDQIEA